MLKDLRGIGYYPRVKTLSASRFGVPQSRKRVFVVASSKSIPNEILFPRPSGKRVSVSAALADLAFLGVNESSAEYKRKARSAYQLSMRGNQQVLYNHLSSDHSTKIQKRFASMPLGWNKRRTGTIKTTKKRAYFRLHPRRLANTLTSIPDDSVHYRRSRAITVREMARLQSFPDNFEFMGPRTTGGKRRRRQCPQYTQVANAVPPLMAEAVFRNLRTVISQHYMNEGSGRHPSI